MGIGLGLDWIVLHCIVLTDPILTPARTYPYTHSGPEGEGRRQRVRESTKTHLGSAAPLLLSSSWLDY
jgi:hypothetical protein